MDHSLAVRRAIMAAIKADASVTELVPTGNIHPATVRAGRPWPFIRYGAPIAIPFRASGLNSSSVRPTIHAFTKPLFDQAGRMIQTAEDRCALISAAIGGALDAKVLVLDGGMRATLSWLGSNCIMDRDEPDAWHAIVSLSADVAG